LAWRRLVLILDSAARRLREPVWLSVWEALEPILDAYALDRSAHPVPEHTGATGFPTVIRPAVEGSIARRRQLLATLRWAIESARTAPEPVAALPQLGVQQPGLGS